MDDRAVALAIGAFGMGAWLVIRVTAVRWPLLVSSDVLASVIAAQMIVVSGLAPAGLQSILISYNRAVLAGILAVHAWYAACVWLRRRRRAPHVP